MIVAFLRHAATAWNDEGRMQGRRDVPLSDRGREQARRWRLPPGSTDNGAVRWVTSPLVRARETAALIGAARPACVDALIEMDWGGWEGRRLDEIETLHAAEYARQRARGLDFRPPGGESPREVQRRLLQWLAQAVAENAPVVAVTHLGVLRALLAAATGWDMVAKPPLKLAPESLHRFDVDARGGVAIVECNIPLAAPAPVAGERPV